jgi:hypothetical protein
MDTRFQVPVNWSAVRADAVVTAAEGEVGVEGESEHPMKSDMMTPAVERERKACMTSRTSESSGLGVTNSDDAIVANFRQGRDDRRRQM